MIGGTIFKIRTLEACLSLMSAWNFLIVATYSFLLYSDEHILTAQAKETNFGLGSPRNLQTPEEDSLKIFDLREVVPLR